MEVRRHHFMMARPAQCVSVCDHLVTGSGVTVVLGGYWLVGGDGGLFDFGSAKYHGSMGGVPLQAPVVGLASAGPVHRGGVGTLAKDERIGIGTSTCGLSVPRRSAGQLSDPGEGVGLVIRYEPGQDRRSRIEHVANGTAMVLRWG